MANPRDVTDYALIRKHDAASLRAWEAVLRDRAAELEERSAQLEGEREAAFSRETCAEEEMAGREAALQAAGASLRDDAMRIAALRDAAQRAQLDATREGARLERWQRELEAEATLIADARKDLARREANVLTASNEALAELGEREERCREIEAALGKQVDLVAERERLSAAAREIEAARAELDRVRDALNAEQDEVHAEREQLACRAEDAAALEAKLEAALEDLDARELALDKGRVDLDLTRELLGKEKEKMRAEVNNVAVVAVEELRKREEKLKEREDALDASLAASETSMHDRVDEYARTALVAIQAREHAVLEREVAVANELEDIQIERQQIEEAHLSLLGLVEQRTNQSIDSPRSMGHAQLGGVAIAPLPSPRAMGHAQLPGVAIEPEQDNDASPETASRALRRLSMRTVAADAPVVATESAPLVPHLSSRSDLPAAEEKEATSPASSAYTYESYTSDEEDNTVVVTEPEVIAVLPSFSLPSRKLSLTDDMPNPGPPVFNPPVFAAQQPQWQGIRSPGIRPHVAASPQIRSPRMALFHSPQ